MAVLAEVLEDGVWVSEADRILFFRSGSRRVVVLRIFPSLVGSRCGWGSDFVARP